MAGTFQTSLPELNNEELNSLFGEDRAALRRYRALSALFHQGKTQREAAAEAEVCERTVRNTLRTFGRRGVAGLQSKPGGLWRRGAARQVFEQVLRDALQAEPEAGGDRLWRKACELLGNDGPTLSRRTAYRILADLRSADEDGTEGDGLFGRLRAGLPLLMESPPLSLGTSPLAQLLLPDEDSTLARGQRLQSALHAAIDQLRPEGEENRGDRTWWPYLICSGEYREDLRRSELQQSLSLSASTYSRAKRSALSRMLIMLPALLNQAEPVTDTSEPDEAIAVPLDLLARAADLLASGGNASDAADLAAQLQTFIASQPVEN